MGNKRNSKSVVITIIVTVIVLAVLSVIGIRYLMPYYAQDANAEEMQYTIYKFAVRLFPLLVGLVLIVIASMIASNKEDDADQDDLLPPNSYDQQLFEVPSDDPVRRPQTSTQPEAKNTEEPEVVSSNTISDDDFFAIFGEPERKETPVEEVIEEAAEDEVVEEAASESQTEVAPVLTEEAETKTEPEEEPVEEENDKEEVAPVEPQVAPAKAEPSSSDKLVDAVYALVNKLDEMADLITYEEDEEYEEEPEPEPAPAPQPQPQPIPVYQYQYQPVANYSALEHKIDKLVDSIAMLTDLVSSRYVAAAAPAPAPTPAPAPEPVAQPQPKPQPEPVKVEEPPVVAEPPKAVAEKAEDPADQIINDYDATDPVHLMKIEFDSAQEDEYDITFAFTKASADKIKLSLAEVADAFEVNKKTVVVIPFLTYDEAMAELDRENVKCSQTIFVAAGQKEDFDSLIAPKLG